jgi:hypothetical protein
MAAPLSIAPLCDTIDMPPGRRLWWEAMVRLTRRGTLTKPRPFGPIAATPAARAAAVSRACKASPSPPISANPLAIRTTPPTSRPAVSSMSSVVRSADMQLRTASTGRPRSLR